MIICEVVQELDIYAQRYIQTDTFRNQDEEEEKELLI